MKVTDQQIEEARRYNLLSLLPAGTKLRHTGNGRYMARCTLPPHEDDSPSMSLVKYPDGCWRYRCFGCGEAGDPIKYVEKTRGLDFMGAVKELAKEAATAPERPRLVDTYRYLDEDGTLLYEVLRYEPKSFRQRSPGLDGKGWCWSTQGLRRVLYRLPKLVSLEPGTTVYYVEGEKDVHTLEKLGQTGTTHAGGAGSFRPEIVDSLRQFRVVVVPDRDDPGMALMRKVWAACRDRKIDVGFALLPDGRGKDVTEFFEKHGGTVTELEGLVK